ncbi:hypothetical protein C8R48DRAFT_670146 [Suillus tomentosus]|nr:hypothetical protein C8R48DRAFT_670146 [Suillus tomentosus]
MRRGNGDKEETGWDHEGGPARNHEERPGRDHHEGPGRNGEERRGKAREEPPQRAREPQGNPKGQEGTTMKGQGGTTTKDKGGITSHLHDLVIHAIFESIYIVFTRHEHVLRMRSMPDANKRGTYPFFSSLSPLGNFCWLLLEYCRTTTSLLNKRLSIQSLSLPSMNRLTSDPHVEVCPDFTLDFYRTSRAPLVALNNTDAEAAALLQTVWVTTNAARRTQWQDQVAADNVLAVENQRLLNEETDRELQAQCLADATIDEEEKKKNRLKHIPIPKRPHPSHANENILVSDFALRKLEKGHYVEIYYWTNKGIADAHLVYHATNDEGMVPNKTADGATMWIPASATRPSTTVVPDCNLEALDFAQAIPRLVTSLTERGWGHDRVHMLADVLC